MVFDISSWQLVALLDLWSDTLEFSHDDLHWLSNNVSEGVQSASMGHRDDKFSGAEFNRGIEQIFQTGDKGLATFKTETFGCIELLRHEVAPLVCLV